MRRDIFDWYVFLILAAGGVFWLAGWIMGNPNLVERVAKAQIRLWWAIKDVLMSNRLRVYYQGGEVHTETPHQHRTRKKFHRNPWEDGRAESVLNELVVSRSGSQIIKSSPMPSGYVPPRASLQPQPLFEPDANCEHKPSPVETKDEHGNDVVIGWLCESCLGSVDGPLPPEQKPRSLSEATRAGRKALDGEQWMDFDDLVPPKLVYEESFKKVVYGEAGPLKIDFQLFDRPEREYWEFRGEEMVKIGSELRHRFNRYALQAAAVDAKLFTRDHAAKVQVTTLTYALADFYFKRWYPSWTDRASGPEVQLFEYLYKQPIASLQAFASYLCREVKAGLSRRQLIYLITEAVIERWGHREEYEERGDDNLLVSWSDVDLDVGKVKRALHDALMMQSSAKYSKGGVV